MGAVLSDQLLPAIAWTLVHSLWQGLILAVLAGVVLLLTPRSTAARRYAALGSLFFLFLGSMLLTFLAEWTKGPRTVDLDLGAAGSLSALAPLRRGVEEGILFLHAHTSGVVLVWLVVVLYKGYRMIREMSAVRLLRREGIQAAPGHWRLAVRQLSAEMGINRPVALLQSIRVKVPVVIGYLKPLILVPAGMLNHLPPSQLEAILLHELAHIRRHDYLVNYLQRLAEVVFFFNPALLWVSSLLRAERENCCDEVAIARTGDKLPLVEALIHCKEYAMRTPGYAIGFFGPRKLLLHRLNRIVSNSNRRLSAFEAGFLVLGLLILGGLMSAVGQSEKQRIDRTVRPPEVLKASGPVSDQDRIEVDVLYPGAKGADPAQEERDREQAGAESQEAKQVVVRELINEESPSQIP